MRVCARACARVRSSNTLNLKDRTENNYIKTSNKICERPLLSPSQDRDPEVSGLYEITVTWLRARVGNPYINTLRAQRYADRHRQADTHVRTHADTDNNANTPTCTDSFAVAPLDPVSYAHCQPVAKFL